MGVVITEWRLILLPYILSISSLSANSLGPTWIFNCRGISSSNGFFLFNGLAIFCAASTITIIVFNYYSLIINIHSPQASTCRDGKV